MEYIPRLKTGVEIDSLDSSYKEKKYILSCEGNQWQINEYFRDILDLIDGNTTLPEITEKISLKYQRLISEDEISYIINNLLGQRGVLEGTQSTKQNSMFQSRFLWLKIPLLPKKYVNKFDFLKIFFNRNIFILFLSIGICVQLFLLKDFLSPKYVNRIVSADTSLFISAILISVLLTLMHELGHAVACMRYKAEPGSIGFGVYFAMPVFYSDVSSTWRLNRKQRIVVDMGGMYLEGIPIAILTMYALLSNNEYLRLTMTLNILQSAFNLNPFIKMDGYWIFSDLIGIPNLHKKVTEFFMHILYSILRIEKDKYSLDINGKERKAFYIFAIFNGIYFLFFSYTLLLAFYYSIINFYWHLQTLFAAFHSHPYIGQKAFIMLSFIYGNLFTIFTIFAIGIFLFTVLSKIYNTVKQIIQSLKAHMAD